jgi:hypothetical protein
MALLCAGKIAVHQAGDLSRAIALDVDSDRRLFAAGGHYRETAV